MRAACGCTIKEDLSQPDPRNAIGDGVVRLDHQRLATAIDPVDQVDLPQRAIARKWRLVDSRAQSKELRSPSRRPQPMMKKVGIKVRTRRDPLQAPRRQRCERDLLLKLRQLANPRSNQ